MKRLFAHINAFLLGISVLLGQSAADTSSYKFSFQDSIRIALENTKAIDATTIGASFGTAWNDLGPDQQMQIRRQVKLMKKKGYRLRPQFVNYYGALVAAVTIEKTDVATLTNFLQVAGQVIEKDDNNRGNLFFQYARDFFEHHALNYEKGFRLHASEDQYRFKYIEAVVVSDTMVVDSDPADTLAWDAPSWKKPIVQPELAGPVIQFDKLTLTFATPFDSAFLKNTKGSFSLRNKLFVGEGGIFDWSTAGLSPDSVYYELKKYNFKAQQPQLKAQQGKLQYVGKVSGAIPGMFEFKSISRPKDKAPVYPRFTAYERNISLLGIPDSLKYTGGFGLLGKVMNGNALTNGVSTLELSGATDKKFKVQSKYFSFMDSVIVASNARVVIYQGNDSIRHPSMLFTYNYGKQKVTVVKDNTPLRKAPFSSSFFNLDFNADQLVWDLKSDSMNIYVQGSGNVAPLVFESTDFYNPEDYRQLKGLGFKFHPLVLVANFARAINSQDFFASELINDAHSTYDQVAKAMQFLAQKGMIDYDATTGKIHVRDKALHWVDAKKDQADYDDLKIHSLTDKAANATINFPKRYMTVRGVEEFDLSDSLNVQIKPDSSVITFLQNRDIKFNGTINAGNFEITGKNFTLKYDSFFINLSRIDSIRFYVTEKDGTRRRVNNSMVGADSTAAAAGGMQASANKTSGTLFINRPNNKAGKLRIPHYPRLDATAGGVIYFNRQEVLDGAYDQSVFFVVPPFKLDSLSDVDPGAINFDGTFVSSGMFPSFKEKLHTMPDKSLGFVHAVPKEGYKLYQGDGKLYGGMSLDNAGIRATGKIEFLAASLESKDFIFYPDSVVGKGNIGEILEKQFGNVHFPQVTMGDYQMKWLPKQDKLRVKNTREPFSLYDKTATLNGNLTVSKSGVAGAGRLSTRGSDVSSKELSFSAENFGARHAKFEVKTGNPDKPALAGNDVRLKFNLQENFATVSPEVEGAAAIDFPYAQFKTSITEARWDLNTQKITMSKAPDVPIENSYFYTTRKELDSLSFNAEKAEYDIKAQQLKVSGIPFIVVADAKITPENNEVLILENARIGQLKNTTIVLDTLNGFHRLTEGVVDIVSRKEFSGYATYQYVNAANDTFAIKMTDFHLEPIETADTRSRKQNRGIATQQTVGNGSVDEKANIHVAPRIFYKGDMTMYATRPALQLRGYVKLDLRKIKNYDTWLRYEQSGDEKEIYLDFDKSLTEEGRKADAGLHFADNNSLYITFVSDKKDPGDEDFFLPSGSLFFDKESGEFKIEDRLKAAGEKLSGKVFNYNEDKQEVRFEGPVTFFRGGKDFNLISSALGSGNLETNDIKMNSFIMADMNVPAAAYQLMALNLQDVIKNEGAAEGLGDQTELLYKIADIIGERAVKEYEQKSLQGYVPLSTIPPLAKPIVFSNVNLKWSQDHKAFYSEGPLGISNIGRNDINGAFEGFMEIRKNEDGSPVFHFFFKASPDAWYYFGYEDNRLMIHSSNQPFNDLIGKKTNASKAKVGELVFIPGSNDETLAFINRFRLEYYGIEVPYDLTSGSSAAKKKEKKKEEEDDGF